MISNSKRRIIFDILETFLADDKLNKLQTSEEMKAEEYWEGLGRISAMKLKI